VEGIEEIENGLIPFGIYGKKRATVCRQLILDMLKQPAVREHSREGRAKAAAAKGVRKDVRSDPKSP
jgi:hypothetical protein